MSYALSIVSDYFYSLTKSVASRMITANIPDAYPLGACSAIVCYTYSFFLNFPAPVRHMHNRQSTVELVSISIVHSISHLRGPLLTHTILSPLCHAHVYSLGFWLASVPVIEQRLYTSQ